MTETDFIVNPAIELLDILNYLKLREQTQNSLTANFIYAVKSVLNFQFCEQDESHRIGSLKLVTPQQSGQRIG